MIEEKSFIVNKEFTEEYLKGSDKQLFENTILSLNSSSSARLQINLLPGEERPDAINTSLVANRLRELVGPVVGVERLIFGSGGNFGGSPVSVSLLSNNISELKAAKLELKSFLESLSGWRQQGAELSRDNVLSYVDSAWVLYNSASWRKILSITTTLPGSSPGDMIKDAGELSLLDAEELELAEEMSQGWLGKGSELAGVIVAMRAI